MEQLKYFFSIRCSTRPLTIPWYLARQHDMKARYPASQVCCATWVESFVLIGFIIIGNFDPTPVFKRGVEQYKVSQSQETLQTGSMQRALDALWCNYAGGRPATHREQF